MKDAADPSALTAGRRFLFRSGKTIGLIVFVAALVGVIYLRFFTPLPSPREAWPTEGYYFAGAQYQVTLQTLRLTLAQVHQSTDEAVRAQRRRDAMVLRDVLHAKFSILMDSPELSPYLRQVQGFRDAIEPLTKLNSDLDRLVKDAASSHAGLERFEATVVPMYELVLGMVNDLRVAELAAFESAFDAQIRAAKAYQEVGLALLAVLGVGIYFHVVTSRKERSALKKEAEARAEAQRSAQARAALLGMVSHELRTPLQTMLANVELLSLHPREDGFGAAVDSLERCIELISGQLDNIAQYTRLASGTFELRRERFVVMELLQRVVDEHVVAAQNNDQVLSLLGPEDPALAVHGDTIRLHQVINNFISNAIKYSGPGTITISARLLRHRFGAFDAADAVEIRVEDDGPGIPAAEQAAIWEPFVRGKRGPNRQKGSGLGLAVVKLLATSAGWEVGVHSDAQKGAAFYVRLPLSGPSKGAR